MPRHPLVIHERLGRWARQLRPRVAGWPVRLVETRSGEDLASALSLAPFPLVVIDLDRWPARILADLQRVRLADSSALALVLDPGSSPGVPTLARELGATLVKSGFVPPPEVEALLARWLGLARTRLDASGWSLDQAAEPEPWDEVLTQAT